MVGGCEDSQRAHTAAQYDLAVNEEMWEMCTESPPNFGNFEQFCRYVLATPQDQILCAQVLPELAVHHLWQMLSVMRQTQNVLRPRSSCHPNSVPPSLVDCQFQN